MKEIFQSFAYQPEVQTNMPHKFNVFLKTRLREDQTRLPQTPWIHPATEVLHSNISGKGIFITKNIRKNEIVLVCGGQLFHNHEIQSGKARLQSLTGFAEGVYLGAPFNAPEGMDEYLNHSCNPNLWLKDEVTLVACRAISAGEELTVDYATWEIDEFWSLPNLCNCGSHHCRHTISGKDWMLHSLQSRYNGHFLPCLNLRIRNQIAQQRNKFISPLILSSISRIHQTLHRIFQKFQGGEEPLEIIPTKIID
jgi:uncharacterized protein